MRLFILFTSGKYSKVVLYKCSVEDVMQVYSAALGVCVNGSVWRQECSLCFHTSVMSISFYNISLKWNNDDCRTTKVLLRKPPQFQL